MRAFLHSRLFSLSIKVGLTALAFWFVARQVEAEHMQDLLRSQNRTVFIEAAALTLLQVAFGIGRWQAIMRAFSVAIGFVKSAMIFYVSIFFNCCLPGTVGGDVVRVWMLKQEQVPLPLSISAVILDRLLTLFSLALLGFATMPALAGYWNVSPWLLMPPVFLLACGGLWLLFSLDRIFPAPGWLQHFLQSLRLMASHRKAAFYSIMHGVLAHACFSLCAYVLAQSLGADISVWDAVALMPWVLLVSMAPVSIGGWGVRELGAVYFLGLVGVPKAVALAVSVQLGLIAIVVTLPGGLIWLVQRKKSA